jgi:acetyl-CoA C-acetyltransferase
VLNDTTRPAEANGSSNPTVIVGAGQIRRRPALDSDGRWDPKEPAEIMAMAIAAAFDDCTRHGGPQASELAAQVDGVAVVDPISWGYDDLVGSTAAAAGLTPTIGLTCPPGGNSPGDLLNELAGHIAHGSVKIAVLAGCETLYSVRRARKEGVDLRERWTPFSGHRDFLKGQRPLTTPLEARHGLTAPIHCYPLLEVALRAAAGRSVAQHQASVGALMSRNAAVAAQNPYAWFPDEHTADEIITVGPQNRWVCFPYPKLMNAIMEVDQSAAILLMSQSEADRLGVPRSAQVKFLGGASCQDPWTAAERPNLARSEGIAAAAAAAFEHSGPGVDSIADIDLIDLYSCFPSAVQLGMKALGIDDDDPRGVSLTGGLAYAGGPGNSYALHSMCVAVDSIRSGRGRTALVTSLGMVASKHAVSIFGVDSVGAGADSLGHKVKLSETQLHGPALVDGISGPGRVVSYTVEFDRAGEAVRTVYIVDLDDGTRTVGNGPCDAHELGRLLNEELVGSAVMVTGGTPPDPEMGGQSGPGVPNRVGLL